VCLRAVICLILSKSTEAASAAVLAPTIAKVATLARSTVSIRFILIPLLAATAAIGAAVTEGSAGK